VRAGGRPVRLRGGEFELLAYFLENRDRVLSRPELVRALKGGSQVQERTVDAWIKRLREALAGAGVAIPIRTVRELGYVYDSY
jgi:two-component system phosphate regulon response regulator PhoB